jgi:class 3 adenylate cyclase
VRRVSDADRTAVVDRLRAAAGDGAITLDELEDRLAAAYAARTVPDLAALTADLPVASTEPEPHRARRSGAMEDRGFRAHLRIYLMVIGMLVGTWLLAGAGHPWPFYPAAGWGIAVGLHHQAASSGAADRRRRHGPERLDRASSRAQPVTSAPGIPAIAGTAPSRDVPERRFVVAMFVDVVGSTRLNEALGDEQWVRVRTTFRQQVQDCAAAHGGWEANTSGDGVLVRFQDPASAAGAATEIMRRLDEQRTETGFAPSVRIGIHSGDAVTEGDDILGNVVNLAARVTEAADADEILVTEHVADHLDGRHTTVGRGLHTLKGIARPRHLLALVWR